MCRSVRPCSARSWWLPSAPTRTSACARSLSSSRRWGKLGAQAAGTGGDGAGERGLKQRVRVESGYSQRRSGRRETCTRASRRQQFGGCPAFGPHGEGQGGDWYLAGQRCRTEKAELLVLGQLRVQAEGGWWAPDGGITLHNTSHIHNILSWPSIHNIETSCCFGPYCSSAPTATRALW